MRFTESGRIGSAFTDDLFAWTVVVILCSLAIEKLLMAGVRRLNRNARGRGADHD